MWDSIVSIVSIVSCKSPRRDQNSTSARLRPDFALPRIPIGDSSAFDSARVEIIVTGDRLSRLSNPGRAGRSSG
jgi:hypothetical protein